MKISMKQVHQYMIIFFNFSPTSNHLHLLRDENCDSNSRLVVDEDDNVKSGLKGLKVEQSVYLYIQTQALICLDTDRESHAYP